MILGLQNCEPDTLLFSTRTTIVLEQDEYIYVAASTTGETNRYNTFTKGKVLLKVHFKCFPIECFS